MNKQELIENRGKLVRFRGCVLILKGAKTVTDESGGTRIKVLLKDRRLDSYVIARAEEVSPINE
ncbi:MAG: hypothetical protein IJ740_03475 [Ruminococcus sp.]|nr:hypothetical protein [Ruminococcus sp.]